jgi:hypothetical protein
VGAVALKVDAARAVGAAVELRGELRVAPETIVAVAERFQIHTLLAGIDV